MLNYKCLYFLENTSICVIEIEKIYIATEELASKRFSWLKIDKETLTIVKLIFNSMDSAGEIEERYFDQGYLKFNLKEGTFIEKFNSAQHPLERRMIYRMSTPLKNAIEEYIAITS